MRLILFELHQFRALLREKCLENIRESFINQFSLAYCLALARIWIKKKAGWYNLFQAPYFLDERRPRIKGKYRKMPFLPIFPLTKIPTPTAFLLVWIFAANHVLGNLSLGKKKLMKSCRVHGGYRTYGESKMLNNNNNESRPGVWKVCVDLSVYAQLCMRGWALTFHSWTVSRERSSVRKWVFCSIKGIWES